MNKKGAMEMSVGTIVTIVLLMTVLILGLVLVRGIFNSATGAIDMTDVQLKNELQNIFLDEGSKVTIIPTTQMLEIRQGKTDEIGVGITNKISGADASTAEFSYELEPFDSDLEECGISKEELMDWFSREEMGGIQIPPGGVYAGRIRVGIPDNAPLCTFGFHLKVFVDEGNGEEPYASPIVMDVRVK